MDDNKQIALRLFDRFSAGDIPGAMELMSEDVAWQTAGRKELLPAAGVYDRARLRKLFDRMFARLEGGLQMTVERTVCEGDMVAVEARSRGDLKDGRQYRQVYGFFIRIRDGKIAEVREHLDTQHVHEVWFRE